MADVLRSRTFVLGQWTIEVCLNPLRYFYRYLVRGRGYGIAWLVFPPRPVYHVVTDTYPISVVFGPITARKAARG